MRLLNEVGFDTAFGHRRIRLLHGDIADSDAPCVVISTHANPTVPIEGSALEALGLIERARSRLEPMSIADPTSLLGCWRIPDASRLFLVIRLPGAARAPTLVPYQKGLETLFASLAMLEFEGRIVDHVAMTMLGGDRGYEPEDVLRRLIDASYRWLRFARTTRRIDLVLFDSSHLDEWESTMDEVVGRATATTKGDALLAPLAAELYARLSSPCFGDPEVQAKFVGPVAGELGGEGVPMIRVGRLSAPARVLAEAFVKWKEQACALPPLKSAGDLYARIERLQQESLLDPWIIQHLHALRVYGNEMVHYNEKGRVLGPHDLPGILASMLRVILEWSGGVQANTASTVEGSA